MYVLRLRKAPMNCRYLSHLSITLITIFSQCLALEFDSRSYIRAETAQPGVGNSTSADSLADPTDHDSAAVAVFSNVYLGTRMLPPSDDGNGSPLKKGMMYFDARAKFAKTQIYDGKVWTDIVCTPPNCPEIPVSYKPPYPPLGKYSLPDACTPIHSAEASKVTLLDGEKLQNAFNRLLSGKHVTEGGVIEIPWKTKIVQCDDLRVRPKDISAIPKLTIKGIVGPNGEQPRFYCRISNAYSLGGTIPINDVTKRSPEWFKGGGNGFELMVENIHVDGYKKALSLASSGIYKIRNSYFHHGSSNGISNTNTGNARNFLRSVAEPSRFTMEFCGSEISHYGQGNHTHNFYMHRSLGGGGGSQELKAVYPMLFDTWSKNVIVDSIIHSAGWASNFKSIANEVIIVNNKIYSELATDPSYTNFDENGDFSSGRFAAQMLIDVSACSKVTIKGNELYNFKVDKPSKGGSALIGVRRRRTAMRGCDIPLAWWPYGYGPDESKTYPAELNQSAGSLALGRGSVHTDGFWSSLGGKVHFPWIVENNLFSVQGPYSSRQTAMHLYGTSYVFEGPKKVSCSLPSPKNWYERSRVYLKNNTYIGFKDMSHIYESKTGSGKNANCPKPYPETRSSVKQQRFEILGGETYKFSE